MEKLSSGKHIEYRLDVHDKRLNNHGERLDRIELTSGRLEERLNNLINEKMVKVFLDPGHGGKDPGAVEWRGNPALLLGDKIAVVDKDEENEYFVTRQELEYTGALRARLSGRRA